MSLARSARRAARLGPLTLILCLGFVPVVQAASVSTTLAPGTPLTVQATPGDVDRMTFGEYTDMGYDFAMRFVAMPGGATLAARSGCQLLVSGAVSCGYGHPVTAYLEDRDDVFVEGTGIVSYAFATVYGGLGNDEIATTRGALYGEAGNDTLRLNPHTFATSEVLDGGSGNDTLSGIEGADNVRGGTGTDTLTFRGTRAAVSVTLDDVANDGTPLDAANVRSDVENIIGSITDDALGGSDAANVLDGDEGSDSIQGNGGRDRLLGGDGDDVISARDGDADTIDCGFGADTATVDPVDTVANCERVLLPDDDRDGITAPSDCDDGNAGIHPGAIDVPNDGIDEDCVGGDAVAVIDADRDGASSATDCDDHDARRFPGNRDIPGDRLDQDCDGRDAPYPQLRAGVVFTTIGVRPHKTQFLALTAFGVKRGDSIRVTCKGRGCPRHAIRRHIKHSSRAMKLLRGPWKRATLGPGARVTVTFTHAGFAEKRVRFTTRRKFGAPPTRVVTCRPPNGRATRC